MTWVSVVVSVSGAVVGVVGFLFTWVSRSSPYQQRLYDRQLDAATDVLRALGRFHDEAMSGGADTDALWDDFAGSFRRWNVILPEPVTGAVTRYQEALAKGPGEALADAYAAVVGAARRELGVSRLSDKTVGLIGSLPQQSIDRDPLYVKALAEGRFFRNFTAEAAGGATSSLDEADLVAVRRQVYVDDRNLFLVHVWRPSSRPGHADIAIRLSEHSHGGGPERPLTQGLVEKVEYYLGSAFGGVFEKRDAVTGFQLDVRAYGSTLCVARVSFTDGTPPLTLLRYLDFAVAPAS